MNKVYLALPCFNPDQTQWHRVAEFYKLIKTYPNSPFKFDLTVIDDGSPKWTPPPEGFNKDIAVVRLSRNKGKGGALLSAVQKAKGPYDIFAFIDFDIPYSAQDLMHACLCVKAGVDIAIGDRSCWWQTTRAGKYSRNLSHKIFRFFIRTLVIGGLHDTQCGIKAFKFQGAKLISKKAKLNGFLFDVEWLYIAARHRLTIQNFAVRSQKHHTASNFMRFFNFKLAFEFSKLFVAILRRTYDSHEIVRWKNSQLSL